METQYSILSYRTDLYFCDYKLAIKVDERGHNNRSEDYEIQRQKAIENELNCRFIRIKPDEQNFNIFKAQNKIFRHIRKTNKKLNKKTLIEKLSIRLLSLEFKSNDSVKTKCLRYVVKKILPKI